LISWKNCNYLSLRQILLFGIITIFAFTINDVYGDAVCPKDTKWDGENCVYLDTGKPIVFTDYLGNPVKKSEKIEENIQVQQTIFVKPQQEILAEIMVKEPEIKEIADMRGKALEQKITNDAEIPTNLTRNNYHFHKIIEDSVKNAEIVFDKLVYGKQIQNLDFGENHEYQVIYSKRYERSEDPILQSGIIFENQRAQQTFIKTFGNFTNH
jgi:hypothetical protein